MSLIWLVFTSTFLTTTLLAQKITIEGKVRDANTHREISAVNIYIKELRIGTVANTAGRFQLDVLRPDPQMIVTFQHVAYDTLQLTMEEVLSQNSFYMQERIIAVPAVRVESIEDQLQFDEDMPRSVTVFHSQVFDLKGYIDVGDLLRTDHSIQIDEELSGKKTLSIRGGNPDEVIILYNGIKMNPPLDNVFDISTVDLTDVERFEIIKGSNTALYGSEGFSGVINITPRAQPDFNIRFQQRFGTYDTGTWGLHLYKNIGNLHGAYNIKKGGSQRSYADDPQENDLLENSSEHHTASIAYNFSETPAGQPLTSLGVMYVRSGLNYQNERYNESLENLNQMISARFRGNVAGLRNFTVSTAYQWLDEEQFLRYNNSFDDSGFLERAIENKSWHFNAENLWSSRYLDFTLGYQYRNSDLDFRDNISFAKQASPSINSAVNRETNGLTAITRVRPPSGSDVLQKLNFDLSLRFDVVDDEEIRDNTRDNSGNPETSSVSPLDNFWSEGMVKFTTQLGGNNGKFAFNTFVTVGTNVKFPTLLQQISTQDLVSSELMSTKLAPERIRSLEIGFRTTRELDEQFGVYGWQMEGNFFRNQYDNKIRSYYLPGTPIAVYDNVNDADLSGFEGKLSTFFFRKKATIEFGASRYFFSDQNSFPFKYDRKFTANIMIDQAGYSFQVHGFKVGDQIAQIRDSNGNFFPQRIPQNINFDLHFSKTFEINKLKLILNTTIQNLRDDDFELQGLLIRDRRYYLTVGVQY